MHWGEESIRFVCQDCGYTFRSIVSSGGMWCGECLSKNVRRDD